MSNSWKRFLVFQTVLLIIAAVFLAVFFTYRTSSDIEYRKAFAKYYRVFTPELPDKIDFAGEDVPLNIFYVKESLDKEIILNTYWQSRTLLVLKRAQRWFPIIEPILKENGVPDDFKYLAVIESELENKISNMGATGFWQFLKETGQRNGLEINDCVDERYNVELSTQAACKYFLNAYKIYGNWTLAAASFNAGENGISSRIESQKAENYYNMNLPTETARYIFRILALKQIFLHPAKYGYNLRKKDLYPFIQTTTVAVDSTINDLADFAIQNKINYRILKEFNPWLRKTNLINCHKKIYMIKLPQEGQIFYSNYLFGTDGFKMIDQDSLSSND